MKIDERHPEHINQCLHRIELNLMDKLDSEYLEFKWDELVAKLEQIHDEVSEIKDGMDGVMDRFELEYELYQTTSKLEEIHDEMKELKGEVADVKSQVEDLENGDLS